MELGRTVMTRTVDDAMQKNFEFKLFVAQCFERYTLYDFGDLCEEDERTNKAALKNGYRVFASYRIPERLREHDDKLWIITEADRSYTTIMFPSDY